MSEPAFYARSYPDHPTENVVLANRLRTALQGLPGVTRSPVLPTLREPVDDFEVASIHGPMLLSVRPHLTDEGVMFACQFQEPRRAAKRLGSTWGLHRLNPLSGKWNHAFYSYDHDWILRSFLAELLPILPIRDLLTRATQNDDRAQIRAAFQDTRWIATLDFMGEPRRLYATSLYRIRPRKDTNGAQDDLDLRHTEIGQDRAELAQQLTTALHRDIHATLLRNALQSLPTRPGST